MHFLRGVLRSIIIFGELFVCFLSTSDRTFGDLFTLLHISWYLSAMSYIVQLALFLLYSFWQYSDLIFDLFFHSRPFESFERTKYFNLFWTYMYQGSYPIRIDIPPFSFAYLVNKRLWNDASFLRKHKQKPNTSERRRFKQPFAHHFMHRLLRMTR